jgi:alpha-ketoglutaric semialdehyde dehydrogenase
MDGSFLIGARDVASAETFRGFDPSTNEEIAPDFAVSSTDDVAEACRLADEAFDRFRETDPEERAVFLETVAANIEALGDELVQRAVQESGLPVARLTGERGRTTGQLRLFATLLRQGRWANVVVDNALRGIG